MGFSSIKTFSSFSFDAEEILLNKEKLEDFWKNSSKKLKPSIKSGSFVISDDK